MTPLSDNHAANSLGEEIQLRNIRRVAVNARITAVLWLLEFAANFSMFLAWVVINGSSSHGGLTTSMSWFYVILPFTHLMNTSFNKDRVIDDSWKSVILNVVKSVFRVISKRRTSEDEQNDSNDVRPNDETMSVEKKQHKESGFKETKESNLTEPGISTMSNDNKLIEVNINPCTSNGKRTTTDDYLIYCLESGISTISNDETLKETMMNPCTSNGKRSTTDAYKLRDTIRNQSSADSESDGYKNAPAKSQRLKKGETLLSGMWHNSNDEEAYHHYFKQLLELEYPYNKATPNYYNDFNVVIYNKSLYNTKTRKPKRSETNQKSYEATLRKSGRSVKNTRFDETPLNVNFVIDLEERGKMRHSRLEGFLVNCDDESTYENFIKTIISFEEELIEK